MKLFPRFTIDINTLKFVSDYVPPLAILLNLDYSLVHAKMIKKSNYCRNGLW